MWNDWPDSQTLKRTEHQQKQNKKYSDPANAQLTFNKSKEMLKPVKVSLSVQYSESRLQYLL